MSTVTPYLNLVKPAPLEPFSLATYVNNLDLIDAGVKALADRRRHAEYYNTAPFAVSGGLAQWDAGPLTNDGASTFGNTFSNVTSAPSGGINITENGLYTVSALSVPDATPGKAYMFLKVNTFNEATGFTDGTPWELSSSFNKYLTAGSTVRILLFFTTARNCTSRLRITKVAD